MTFDTIKRALRLRQGQIVLAVGVLLVAFSLYKVTAREAVAPAQEPVPDAVVTTSEQSATSDAPVPANIAPSGGKAKNLPDVVEQYAASGYRFQFSECRGTPGSLVVKKGKSYLLDNRDNAAHTFKVEGKTYRVGAYGYAIATARGIGTHMITCDGGGAAQVVVQP